MEPIDPPVEGSARAVVEAYRRYAARIRQQGYRGLWSYVATKALSDWALLSELELRNARVLNVGCSEPIDELFFARQGARCWVGLDQSPEILAAAAGILREELAPALARRVALCAAQAAALPFADGCFDLVVSFSTLEHIPDPALRRRAFAEIARVTRPGGQVAITVPNRYSLFYFCHRKNMATGSSDYGYSYLYRPRELRALLQEVGLTPQRFQSELTGMAELPSYVPGWRLRHLMRRLGIFGERIGYLATRC